MLKPLNLFNTYTKEDLQQRSNESLNIFTKICLRQVSGYDHNNPSKAYLMILANINLLKVVCPEHFFS